MTAATTVTATRARRAFLTTLARVPNAADNITASTTDAVTGELVEAVLFDAVGTLVHLRESVGACYAAHARAHGVALSAARLDDAFARVMRAATPNTHPNCTPRESAVRERRWWRARVRETFRAADQSAHFANFDAFFDAVWTHYQSARAWRLARGARAALLEIKTRGVKLGVLSNFDQRLHALLRALRLCEVFDIVLTPADTGFAKPARESFHAACEKLATRGTRTLYVGDDDAHDIRAARAAGLQALDIAHIKNFGALPARLTSNKCDANKYNAKAAPARAQVFV